MQEEPWFKDWSYTTKIIDPESGYRQTIFSLPNGATRKEFQVSYHPGSVINDVVDLAIMGLENLPKEAPGEVRPKPESEAPAENSPR